ncbi:C40 family peptidase [Paenibacillus xanthanilyticus]|uniref:SH3 domain-containing protein n=1 Tax=Paenibacillus xanthanilyticus TaxID=1783531 RepID=A0ABV8K6J8_9BACL
MKKFTAMTMVSILAASLALPFAASAATGTAEVQASVSFRTQPTTSSTVIRYLKTGENLTVLSEYNDYWLQVRDGSGQVGYVSSNAKYVEFHKDEEPTNAVIEASVSFRTSPSTSAARIRYLQTGERVNVISQPNSYWYEVRDSNGVVGYVSSSAQYISTTYDPASAITDPAAAIESVIEAGMKYWGTPYEFGSDRSTTTTFDCSDFVRTAFFEGTGIILPSDSRGQGAYVQDRGAVTADWSQLKRGDLMFFMDYQGSTASAYADVDKSTATITHVGIYLGNGQVLHTYSTASGGVRTNEIAGTAWEYRFLFGGSVF